jgi:hypothetical protein
MEEAVEDFRRRWMKVFIVSFMWTLSNRMEERRDFPAKSF